MASLPLITLTLLAVFLGTQADVDLDLSIRDSTPICVGKICDSSSAFHYYTCCGTLAQDCCFRFQSWVIVSLIVCGILFVASMLIGLVKCICCCDR
ncbi:unnamed protein product [Bursaphelenchus okinawaensis]|uniref:Uncharacterized protein n=1 Tax=Bursaphelenchus okinawaensis TaxID=465554 RepID=A0A811L045_9BILA|nr:unnamed protein product [Bursaphelenchus okinawaensis]CAG9115106.1 unnamed protein product [Bursaphelenchus okinawaensis]